MRSVCSCPVSVDDLLEEVQSLDPALVPDTHRFKTAVLLVAAATIGHNIDRLARFTGYDREFVAIRARRLLDNGIWTVGASNVSAEEAPSLSLVDLRFSIDVAEGLQRRQPNEPSPSASPLTGRARKTPEIDAGSDSTSRLPLPRKPPAGPSDPENQRTQARRRSASRRGAFREPEAAEPGQPDDVVAGQQGGELWLG